MSFRDSSLYPILYMLVISIIFVGILAVFYRSSETKIASHAENEYNQMVLSLLVDSIAKASGQDKASLMANPDDTLQRYVKPLEGFSRDSFEATVDGETIALLFDIKGKGLWGSMAGLLATDPELTRILDFAIYEQMETPGLGSRITEDAFRSQFQGKPAIPEGKAMDFSLVPEGQAEISTDQVRQITGATITSQSVLKMLIDELNLLYKDKHGAQNGQ